MRERERKRSLFLGRQKAMRVLRQKRRAKRILRKETEVEIPQNFYG